MFKKSRTESYTNQISQTRNGPWSGTDDPACQAEPARRASTRRRHAGSLEHGVCLHRSGCQWDMLPHDLLPKSTVYDYFSQSRDDGTWAKIVNALRERTRVEAGT